MRMMIILQQQPRLRGQLGVFLLIQYPADAHFRLNNPVQIAKASNAALGKKGDQINIGPVPLAELLGGITGNVPLKGKNNDNIPGLAGFAFAVHIADAFAADAVAQLQMAVIMQIRYLKHIQRNRRIGDGLRAVAQGRQIHINLGKM